MPNENKAALEPQSNDVNESNATARLTSLFANDTDAGNADNNGNPNQDATNEANQAADGNGGVSGNSETNANENPDGEPPSNDGKDDKNADQDDKSDESNPFVKSARGWQKRVDKLTAQKKAQESEIELLKREIQELKSGNPAKPQKPANPIDDIADADKLDEYANSIRKERDAVLSILSSDKPDFEINGAVYTREQLAGYLKTLNSDLDDAIPEKRKQFARAKEISDKAAENEKLIAEVFPDFKEGSAEDEWIKEQLSDPLLDANIKTLLHYAWRGISASKIEAKYRKAAAKPKGNTPPAAPQSSPVMSSSVSPILKDGSIDKDFAIKNLFS